MIMEWQARTPLPFILAIYFANECDPWLICTISEFCYQISLMLTLPFPHVWASVEGKSGIIGAVIGRVFLEVQWEDWGLSSSRI